MTVQEQFEKFLEERGIDETLAAFIPEYAEHKEQKARILPSFLSYSRRDALRHGCGLVVDLRTYMGFTGVRELAPERQAVCRGLDLYDWTTASGLRLPQNIPHSTWMCLQLGYSCVFFNDVTIMNASLSMLVKRSVMMQYKRRI